MADLSIIIPSYNTCDLLLNCLASIYQTTNGDFEIIVVDNASEDKTAAEVEKRYGQVKILKNLKNLGFAKAVNQGLREAKGTYLLILNSDTLVSEKTIETELSFLQNHQEVGVVGCQIRNLDGSLQPSGGFLPNLFNVFLWMSFLDNLDFLNQFLKPYHMDNLKFYTRQQDLGWVTGAFLLTTREMIEKVGYFDEKMFMYVEEVDWCARASKFGIKIVFNPQAGVVHLKGSSARDDLAGIAEEFQEILYFFKKHKSPLQMPILRFLLKSGALVRYVLFGIIAKDPEAKRIYAKAYKLA